MKLSIIIPAKDASATLKRCLDSIHVEEPFLNEIILVDDGSTDDTILIANSYSKVKVVQTATERRGVAAARNLGAKTASSEIILFVDSDIILPLNALKIIEKAFSVPTVNAIVGLLDPNSAFKNFASDYKNLWIHYTYLIQPSQTSLFYTSIAAIKRELFLAFGGFDESYLRPGLEDTDFGNSLYQAGKAVHLIPELTAIHIKKYCLSNLFKLDFKRAQGLVKIQLRRGIKGLKRGNLSSVPHGFILSILPAAFSFCFLSLAFLLFRVDILILAIAGFFLTFYLNRGFLTFLKQIRGIKFAMKSFLFIVTDSVVLILGAAFAIIEYLMGKHY